MIKLSPILVHAIADLESHVEAKVKAATTAATVAGFATALVGTLAFHGGTVPEVITAAVGALVTGGLTFLAGWLAKHTPRVVAPTVPVATVSLPVNVASGAVTTQTITMPVAPAAAPAPPATPAA